MKRSLDYPPIWLLGFVILAFCGVYVIPSFNSEAGFSLVIDSLGWGSICVGFALMGFAVLEMRKRKTTIIPHRMPENLVTSGVFRLSRNPIYLGDVFTLLGFSLLWGSWTGLILVPVFMTVIQKRFILVEEPKLVASFGDDFDRWAKHTRRWM